MALLPTTAVGTFNGKHKHVALAVQHLPKGATMSNHVITHFNAIRNNKSLSSSRGFIGDCFELVVYDGLVQFGVLQSDLVTKIKHTKTNAEIDVFVRRGKLEPMALHIKTSLRERWKQLDRDALMINHDVRNCWSDMSQANGIPSYPKPVHWCIFWRETDNTSPAKAAATGRRMGALMGNIQPQHCMSAFDATGMDFLIAEALRR